MGDITNVHRALRPCPGRQARRATSLPGHAVRRHIARGPAVAGIPAPGVGAGTRRSGPEPVPDAVARLDPDLAQPGDTDRMGCVVRVHLPHAHGRRTGRRRHRAPGREPLGARLRHPSPRHAAVPGRHAARVQRHVGAMGDEVEHPVAHDQERDGVGTYGFWALIAVLLLSYVGSLFSPPPPTQTALAVGGIIFGWLFVLWAGWSGRHREGYGVAG